MADGIEGVVYGVTPGGALQWYRHDGWKDGTNHWTAGAGGNNIGGGWNFYDKVFSGGARSVVQLISRPPSPAVADGVNKRIGRAARSVTPGAVARLAGIRRSATAGAVARLAHARIRLPQERGGVISYQRVACDAAGVLRAYAGEVTVAPGEPLPSIPLSFAGESFSYTYRFADESGALRVSAGQVTATAQGSLQVGTVYLGGVIDPRALKAQGSAVFITARVDGSASFALPGAAANAGGYAEGPAARGSAEIGLDGVGAQVGVSAGEIGGHVGVTIGGAPYGVGGEIGLKAELGLHWGTTSTIELPLITITGPNPLAGVASFAAGAVTDFVRDPARAAETAISDILGVGSSVISDAGQVLEDVSDALEDFFSDDEDDHAVTVDQPQGPRKPPPPGGTHID